VSGEDCSGWVLEPRWKNLLRGKPFFPILSAVIRLLSRKSCSSEKSRANVHLNDTIFKGSKSKRSWN
jgi:hypothetical protein